MAFTSCLRYVHYSCEGSQERFVFLVGRIDPQDKDEKSAAIRETIEELGISRENLSEVFPLDFMISPFGMMIYPFVAIIDKPETNSTKSRGSRGGIYGAVNLLY